SGSSAGSTRFPCSTSVTFDPNRANTWPSSSPTAPPPSTTSDAGASFASTASWFVQNSTPSSPGSGGTPGRGPAARPPPRPARAARPRGSRALAGGPAAPPGLALDPRAGGGGAPRVGGLVADARRHRGPGRTRRRRAGEVGNTAGFGERVRRARHHLRGNASPVGALAADEPGLDADDVEPGVGQLVGELPPAPPHPQHPHVPP